MFGIHAFLQSRRKVLCWLGKQRSRYANMFGHSVGFVKHGENGALLRNYTKESLDRIRNPFVFTLVVGEE